MILPDRAFLGCPVEGDLTQHDADVVVLGILHGVSYVVDDEQVAWRRRLRRFEKRASSSPRI